MEAAAVQMPEARERDEQLVQRLYGTYKTLALSTGAALALRRIPLGAHAAAVELIADCDRAAGETRPAITPVLAACRDAATQLAELLEETETRRETPSEEHLQAVRASHSRMRQLVWEVIPCEYTPCSLGGRPHRHDDVSGAELEQKPGGEPREGAGNA